MFLHSASASYAVSQISWAPPVLCPCEVGKIGNGRYCWLGGRSAALFLRCKACWRRCNCKACMLPSDRGKNELNFKFYDPAKKSLKSQKLLVVGQFSDELEYGEESAKKPIQMVSNFTNYREDPLVDKLRSQLGVIHPIPAPPINRNVVGLFVFFFFVGVIFDKLWTSRTRKKENRDARSGIWPQVPSSFSLFLEKDLQRKESVEWVNMVLGKLWKVYREGIENWITGLLQPVIDNLQKPDYVQRVEIKQFSLGEEPLSVRTVERRTSRHANDLQYQIGLRYTGGARALLSLSLNFGIIPVSVPVGIRDFDIDGELWVKLRLIPTEPWVGAVSWAFVSLPKIKFVLSPFRLFNLMAIPVLSMFLRKLLTEDLPRLFVRPKKIVLDFQTGTSVGPVSDDFKTGAAQEGNNDFKTGAAQEGNKDYVGELSVTLVDAQKLAFVFWGKTDPYVVLTLGDQVIRSKKNSQTTVIGSPGQPIWNQDFHLLVANPRRQRLFIQVRDSFGFTDFTIGTAEVELGSLQDTVPTDRIINLQGGWGLFQGGSSGEVLLRLTYKAYVEDEEDDVTLKEVLDGYLSDDEGSDTDETDDEYLQNRWDISGATEKESFIDLLAALLVSEEFQGIVSSETGYTKPSEETSNLVSGSSTELTNVETEDSSDSSGGSPLFWFAVITGLTVLASFNVGGSSLFNP